NFFARKDLSLFARELFAEEIARDKAKDDELQKLEAQRSTNDDVPTPAVPLDVPRGSRRAPGISQITPPTPPPSSRPPGAGTELPTRMSAAALWQAAVTEVDPSPSVQMDWDDEDMSTEIYDKPGQLRIPPTVPHPSGSQRPSASVVQPPAPRGPISIPAVVPAPEPRVASTIPPPLPVGGVSRPPPPRMISSAPGSLAAPGAQASQPGEGAFAGPPTNPTTLPPVVPSSVTMGAPARPSAPGSLAVTPTAPEAEPPAGGVAVAPAGTAPFPGPVPSVDVAATDVDQKRWPLARVLIVGGLGAFVLLAAVFVLLLWWLTPGVGSVEFASTPEDVVVGVDGKSLGARRSPHLIENLEEGAHEVSVTKPGFSPFVRKVDVVAEQVLDLGTVELAKRELPRMPPAGRAGFSLTTEPAGARVAVDGRELDQRTPMEIRTLAAGTHMIEVRPDGNYAPYKTQITLTEGQMLALPELVLQQDHVRVTFESRPSGAKVTLVRGAKSESIGETPTRADVQISLGAWTVQMEADGHTKWVGPLVVPPGHDEIRVFAELTSDGSSPQRPSHSEDEPRSSSRRPSSSDRAPAERPAQAPTTGSTGSASDAMATLQVGTTPWTQVFVDGRFIGNSPQRNIQLRPGEHRVTLVNAELNIKEPLTITLAPGETKKIVKNLLP
ncbi:MAG: PEGA domain-containing protein, partial [Myxococcales bacterium]|nr:PEGA domain-containing protein [Myxococcales bacterium]